jgi:hypothetical protein
MVLYSLHVRGRKRGRGGEGERGRGGGGRRGMRRRGDMERGRTYFKSMSYSGFTTVPTFCKNLVCTSVFLSLLSILFSLSLPLPLHSSLHPLPSPLPPLPSLSLPSLFLPPPLSFPLAVFGLLQSHYIPSHNSRSSCSAHSASIPSYSFIIWISSEIDYTWWVHEPWIVDWKKYEWSILNIEGRVREGEWMWSIHDHNVTSISLLITRWWVHEKEMIFEYRYVNRGYIR